MAQCSHVRHFHRQRSELIVAKAHQTQPLQRTDLGFFFVIAHRCETYTVDPVLPSGHTPTPVRLRAASMVAQRELERNRGHTFTRRGGATRLLVPQSAPRRAGSSVRPRMAQTPSTVAVRVRTPAVHHRSSPPAPRRTHLVLLIASIQCTAQWAAAHWAAVRPTAQLTHLGASGSRNSRSCVSGIEVRPPKVSGTGCCASCGCSGPL